MTSILVNNSPLHKLGYEREIDYRAIVVPSPNFLMSGITKAIFHSLGNTVFPPIEAPGAKEMVWGASIFHPEAQYFEINMVKKDSKMSPVFSASKHTHKAPIQVQV